MNDNKQVNAEEAIVEEVTSNELEQIEETNNGTYAAGVTVEDMAEDMSNADLAKVIALGIGALGTLTGVIIKGVKKYKEKHADTDAVKPEKKGFRTKMSETKSAMKNIWGKQAAEENLIEDECTDSENENSLNTEEVTD